MYRSSTLYMYIELQKQRCCDLNHPWNGLDFRFLGYGAVNLRCNRNTLNVVFHPWIPTYTLSLQRCVASSAQLHQSNMSSQKDLPTSRDSRIHRGGHRSQLGPVMPTSNPMIPLATVIELETVTCPEPKSIRMQPLVFFSFIYFI